MLSTRYHAVRNSAPSNFGSTACIENQALILNSKSQVLLGLAHDVLQASHFLGDSRSEKTVLADADSFGFQGLIIRLGNLGSLSSLWV